VEQVLSLAWRMSRLRYAWVTLYPGDA